MNIITSNVAAKSLLFLHIASRIWAVVTVIVINRQDGKPALPSIDTSLPREVLAVIVTGALYFGVAQAHAYLGYPVHG